MSWIRMAQERLSQNQCAQVRPSGHSMTGVINHRDEVLLAPIATDRVEVGDAVLSRVAGQVYLHLVKSVDHAKGRLLIGNNRGKINGWTSFSKVFGVAVMVDGRRTKAWARVDPALLPTQSKD